MDRAGRKNCPSCKSVNIRREQEDRGSARALAVGKVDVAAETNKNNKDRIPTIGEHG